VKLVRVGPTGTVESIYGYGTLTGYTESNEVASIVSWECSITGYGAYGGIAGVTSLNTITPFTASQTGLAATISGGTGSSATGTVDTDVSGDVTTLNITAAGTAYTVGDTVTITEVGGTPGVATAVIDSVS
jgi:hypothetical protein